MTEKGKQLQKDKDKDKDERVRIPLDPEEALRGLLEVDPESEPVEKPYESDTYDSF